MSDLTKIYQPLYTEDGKAIIKFIKIDKNKEVWGKNDNRLQKLLGNEGREVKINLEEKKVEK